VRLSLRWKIVGGYGLMLLLIALLGWVTYSLFASVREVQRTVFNKALPQLVAVDEIVRSYTAQSAAVRGYLIGSEPPLLDQYQQEVDIASDWEQTADSLFGQGGDGALLNQLQSAGSEFHKLVDAQVLPLAQRGNRSQAFRVLGQEGTPLITEIENTGQALRTSQDAVVRQTEDDLQVQSDRVRYILLIVTIGALVFGIILAIVLPRRLVGNLDKLVFAARAIGRGDFDQKIEIQSGDEVGELAERFKEMQAGLRRLQQLAAHDRELEIAASIQQNLLRRSVLSARDFVVIPIQRQANLVGGDWYDLESRDGSLTVVIGDASGKGIGAALMSTVTLSSLRAERGLGATPQRIIEQANKVLMDATAPDSFTTMIYATIDLATGNARWLNMGHLTPFLLSRDQEPPSGFYVEGPRNRVLGWFDDPGFQETSCAMRAGDRLVLFTDGFLEAKSASGELFGEERLAESLTRYAPLGLDKLGDALISDVERFTSGKIDDDLTMLVVEYRPDRAPEAGGEPVAEPQ
jgi:serine phosphatase RsbU (regulator of sigma subunit)/CHASE3 domain sensor protein